MSTSVRHYSRGRKLIAMRDVQAGASRYYAFDHQGTTQCLTDGAGNVTDRFASDAWGVPVRRTGSSINNSWYLGALGYRDSGAPRQYVRHRFLSPVLGAWLSRDPMPFDALSFAYVLNSPALHADPEGLACKKGVVAIQPFDVPNGPIQDIVNCHCGGCQSELCAARGVAFLIFPKNNRPQDVDTCKFVQWVMAGVQVGDDMKYPPTDSACSKGIPLAFSSYSIDSDNPSPYYSNVEKVPGGRQIMQDAVGWPGKGPCQRLFGAWRFHLDVVDGAKMDRLKKDCKAWQALGRDSALYQSLIVASVYWWVYINFEDKCPPIIKGWPPASKTRTCL